MRDDAEWTLQDADELRTAVGRFVRAGRRESQLPQAQANVLGALDRGGPVTISELAGELKVRHQSARETVAVLSRQELISVTRSEDDARKVICTITAAGRSCLDADREARSAWIVAQTRHLTLAQRRAARGVAEILARLSEDASAG